MRTSKKQRTVEFARSMNEKTLRAENKLQEKFTKIQLPESTVQKIWVSSDIHKLQNNYKRPIREIKEILHDKFSEDEIAIKAFKLISDSFKHVPEEFKLIVEFREWTPAKLRENFPVLRQVSKHQMNNYLFRIRHATDSRVPKGQQDYVKFRDSLAIPRLSTVKSEALYRAGIIESPEFAAAPKRKPIEKKVTVVNTNESTDTLENYTEITSTQKEFILVVGNKITLSNSSEDFIKGAEAVYRLLGIDTKIFISNK